MEQSETKDIESNTESGRTLASIQAVAALNAHPNADNLEIATVLGWPVIVRRGEVQVGQKIVYLEIDSMVSVDVEWLPVAVKDRIIREHIKDKFRVKTIRLRGEISQGLIVSLLSHMKNLDIGVDVTDALSITKYEPPALTGKFALYQSKRVGDFPVHLLKKTDEHRIQSRPQYLTQITGQPYYMTVKMEGTSATYLIDPETGELTVCSRNMKRGRLENFNICPYWYVVNKYKLEEKLLANPHMAIQCEICGPLIQGNLLGLKDLHIYVFNVVDLRTGVRCDYNKLLDFCKQADLPTAPIEEEGPSFNYTTIKQLLEKARGNYAGTKNAREGLVVRTLDSILSFKVINNDYL